VSVGLPSKQSANPAQNAVSARAQLSFSPPEIFFLSFSPCLASRAQFSSFPIDGAKFSSFPFHHAHNALKSLFFSFFFFAATKFQKEISFAASAPRQTSHLGLHGLVESGAQLTPRTYETLPSPSWRSIVLQQRASVERLAARRRGGVEQLATRRRGSQRVRDSAAA